MPRRPLSQRFERAMEYAARLHATQLRKGTDRPYIAHLLGVTSIVLTHGGDEDEAIGALLHDAVEDQPDKTSFDEIRRRFGARVEKIVRGCTDAVTIPKPPWIERKEKYVRHLRHAGHSVRLVSAADKLYNVREILDDYREHGERVWKRFHATKQQALWYYREVAKILTRKGPRALAEELWRVIRELEKAARIRPNAWKPPASRG
jgi:(p)ppGpp synthase/HD superfamily hydrolase